MFRPIWAALSALALILTPSAAMAARVSPMIADLEPDGRGAVTRIEMVSDANNDIAYEVLMMRGDISTEGELELTPAEEDFLVFPTQILLKSKARQVFRVQYVGNPDLKNSEIYYMSIRQLPVEVDANSRSQVQVVINYNVLMNVFPEGARSEPVIRQVSAVTREVPLLQSEINELEAQRAAEQQAALEAEQDARDAAQTAAENDGATPVTPPATIEIPTAQATETAEDPNAPPPTRSEKGLEVLVGNDGNRYFLAGLSTWRMTGTRTDGEPFEAEYTPEQIARFIGAGVVAPGKDRLFFVPMDVELDPTSVTIEIDTPVEQ